MATHAEKIQEIRDRGGKIVKEQSGQPVPGADVSLVSIKVQLVNANGRVLNAELVVTEKGTPQEEAVWQSGEPIPAQPVIVETFRQWVERMLEEKVGVQLYSVSPGPVRPAGWENVAGAVDYWFRSGTVIEVSEALSTAKVCVRLSKNADPQAGQVFERCTEVWREWTVATSSITGTLASGHKVTQANTNATALVLRVVGTDLKLGALRGSPNDTDAWERNGSNFATPTALPLMGFDFQDIGPA